MIYLKTLTQTYPLPERTSKSSPMDYFSYHQPFTDLNYGFLLGLEPQELTVQLRPLDLSIPFNDVIYVSFDNITWQRVIAIKVLDFSLPFKGAHYPLTLRIVASPLRLGTTHASGNIWGLNATPNLVNAGNHTAYAKLVYYAPRLYFPLTQNLIDFAGSSIALTNAASKTYQGVSYPANTPIFNLGLYLSNEFADVAKLTFYNSAIHTIIAQIKSTRYPTDWVIGAGEGTPNLLTANQSNAEVDTSGMSGTGGTFSRTTTAGEFYAGIAGFKIVSTGSNDISIQTSTKTTGLTAGKYYCFSVYAKSSTTAKNWYVKIYWYDAAHALISAINSTLVPALTSFTRLLVIGKAPANTVECTVFIKLVASVVNDVLYIDNLMFEQINETTITVWDDGLKNKLYIDIPNNLLKWTDYTSTIQCAFPTDQFLQENSSYTRKTITIVAIHNGSTKEIHCKYDGGTFNDGSGALDLLVWTNQITLGRFDGSLFNLIQYPYVLSASNYGSLNFTLNPLKFNNFYIANKTAGVIVYENGILTDENGNDITGLVSGSLIEFLPSVSTQVQMTDGLSGKWNVSVNDCYFP
jgi:hypothetical protein